MRHRIAALAACTMVMSGAGVAAAATGPALAAPARGGTAHAGDTGAAGMISTIAGGVGGPALGTAVAVRFPCGVAYGGGNLYAGDSTSVRRVSPQSGDLTTPAGTGGVGPRGDGGPAVRASLVGACGVAVDGSGNLLIADAGHQGIRVVAASTGASYGQAMTAGHIYTVAGNGQPGFSGDGGPATSAEFNGPGAVTVDGAGNLVVADQFNGRVRVVAEHTGTFYGRTMTTGDIYTVAGGGSTLGDGGPATAAGLANPSAVAVDGAGNLVIADQFNQRIRVVAEHTGTFYGRAMTAGDIYTVAGDGQQGFSGDGRRATGAELSSPGTVAVDDAGNLVLADTGNQRIRVVAEHTGTFYGRAMTADDIYTVAGGGTGGDGGPAVGAHLATPSGVAVDGAGNLVIADRKDSRVRAVAEHTGTSYGQPMTAGDIYTVAGNGQADYSGDGGPATSAEVGDPGGLTVDGAGDVLIASQFKPRVRMVAARTGTVFGQAVTAGDIYTVAGDGQLGFSGDGGPATSARLDTPNGVAVDGAGNLMIADTDNNRVRVVAARSGSFYGQAMTTGDIYTVAGDGTMGFSGDGGPALSAELSFPAGVTVDATGNLVITDTDNSRIRLVAGQTGTFYGQTMTAGDIYTVAGGGSSLGDGGPATSAQLSAPTDAAVDGAGNLVIDDMGNERIRVVAEHTGTFYGQPMTAGDIYTVAGNGDRGFGGDGGPATSARLDLPAAVAVDGAGNVVLTDRFNQRVRVVAEETGTFYGVSMTLGDIYTVAGTGKSAFSGDGRLAVKAGLSQPAGVAVDGAGNLVIADTGNVRVRLVTG